MGTFIKRMEGKAVKSKAKSKGNPKEGFSSQKFVTLSSKEISELRCSIYDYVVK